MEYEPTWVLPQGQAERRLMDSMLYEGERWLVVRWYEATPSTERTPALIARPPQAWFAWEGAPVSSWVLLGTLPTAVLEGRTVEEWSFRRLAAPVPGGRGLIQ